MRVGRKMKADDVKRAFERFVPSEVVERALHDPGSLTPGVERFAAILVCDVRSFTTVSEPMTPDRLLRVLNSYFEVVGDAIARNDGLIIQYSGDQVLAVFTEPATANPALAAVHCALAIHDSFAGADSTQRSTSLPGLQVEIGIHCGMVTFACVGSRHRLQYTVMGDAVNLAVQVQGLNRKYGQQLLFVEAVHREIKDAFSCRLVDAIPVKGVSKPVPIYTCKRRLSPDQARAWAFHHGAVKLFQARDLAAAKEQFVAVLELLPDDRLARTYLAGCDYYLENPPPPGDGSSPIFLGWQRVDP